MADTTLDLLNQTQIELLQKYDGVLNRFNEINNYFEDGKAIEAINADLVRGLPADFTSSKNTNGYQKLPSGIIIQWGNVNTIISSASTLTVTYPIAFPTTCISVNGVCDSDYSWYVTEVNLASMTIKNSSNVDRLFTYWIAIGY